MAFVLGSLTFTGAVNVFPFRGAAALGAMLVGLVLGSVVAACVVSAADQVAPSLARRQAARQG